MDQHPALRDWSALDVLFISLEPKATIFEDKMTHCHLPGNAGDFGAAKSWFGGWDDR